MYHSTFIVVFLLFASNYFVLSTNGAVFENVSGRITHSDNVHTIPYEENFVITDDSLSVDYGNDVWTNIRIVGQVIPNLPKDSVKDLPTLTNLRIISCEVKNIDPGAFKNLPLLIEIDLSGNDLETIQNGVFSDLKITSLILTNNKIKTIEDEAFNNMNLRILEIQHNELSRWDSKWLTNTPIYGIYLGDNKISELEADSFNFIRDQDNVKNTIFLQNNNLTKFAPNTFNGCKRIETLNLENNGIEELPANTFEGVEFIKTLRLGYNQLSRIDPDLFKNTKVESLILETNNVSEFPIDLLKSGQVRFIWWGYNPIKCSFVEEVENWVLNKTGDYNRGDFETPFNYDRLKKYCNA